MGWDGMVLGEKSKVGEMGIVYAWFLFCRQRMFRHLGGIL